MQWRGGKGVGVSRDHEELGEPPSDPAEGASGPGLARLSRAPCGGRGLFLELP